MRSTDLFWKIPILLLVKTEKKTIIFNFKITNGTSSEDKIRDIKVVGRKGGMNTGKIKGKYNIMLN